MRGNVIVIGAGPAGMNAALYLKRAGIDVTLIEKNVPGGEMLKTNMIENYLGFSMTSGGELALKMKKQVTDLGVKIVKGKVIEVLKEDKFKVRLENENMIADYVIVASGKLPKKLGIKGEDDLLLRGVSYCAVCDGAFYRGSSVAVVGGGDSALTEALYLADLCDKVYVIARGEIRASYVLQNKVKDKDNIIVLKNLRIDKFIYDKKLSAIVLSDGKEVKVDGVFVAIGGMPDISFLNKLGVDVINGYIKTNEKMQTNIKGLYAVGDVRYKDFYQIITAASDGAVAALSIKEDF